MAVSSQLASATSRGSSAFRAGPLRARFSAKLVEATVAEQFESTFHAGYPAAVITPGDSRRTMKGGYALQDRRVWDNLRGILAVWSLREYSLGTAKVGPDCIYKSTSLVTCVGTRRDANPWLLAVLIIAGPYVDGGVAGLTLRKRQERVTGSG